MGQGLDGSTVETDRKNGKIVYLREFLLSFAELESCKKQPEGIDCTILRDASSSLTSGGVPSLAALSRGLIQRDRESNGVSVGRQDVLEWRRSSNTGPLLQQGSRRGDSSANTFTGNSMSRQNLSWGDGTPLRTNFERPTSQGHGFCAGQSRREYKYATGDREKDKNRLSIAWEQYEPDSTGGHTSGISANGGRQALSSHERGLLGSGGGLRSYLSSPVYSRASDRCSGFGHGSRINEQYNQYQQVKAPTYMHHGDKDSLNDETFGSEDVSSEERFVQERKRRESFEHMRKEQSSSSESQKAACHRLNEVAQLDLSTLSSNEKRNVPWYDEHGSEPLLSSPSGALHSTHLQSDFLKADALDATTTTSSLSLPTNSRPLVPPGFSKPVQKSASKKVADREILLGGPTVEETIRTDIRETEVHSTPKTSAETSTSEKTSVSILDKLFKASTVVDEKHLMSSSFLLDEVSNQETWNEQQEETSRFAKWFCTEDGRLHDVSATCSTVHASSLLSECPSESTSNKGFTFSENNLQQTVSPMINTSQILFPFSDIESKTISLSPPSSNIVGMLSDVKELLSTSESSNVSHMSALFSRNSDQDAIPSSVADDLSFGLASISKHHTEDLPSNPSISVSCTKNFEIHLPFSCPLTADSLFGGSCKNYGAPAVPSSSEGEDLEFETLQGHGHILPMPVGPSLEDVEKVIHCTVITTSSSVSTGLEISPGKVTHVKSGDFMLNPEAPCQMPCEKEIFLDGLFTKPQPFTKASHVFLTCEDLEQSMLAKVSESPMKEPVRKILPDFENYTLEPNSSTDNNASEYLLSLLHKGFSNQSCLEPSNSSQSLDCYDQEESLLKDKAKLSLSTQISNASTEIKDCRPAEFETLETLFGKAFMNELQSMEAPVSGKDLLLDSASGKEDGIQFLMNIMSSSKKSSTQLDDLKMSSRSSVGAIGQRNKRVEFGNEEHAPPSNPTRMDNGYRQDVYSGSAARNTVRDNSVRPFNERCRTNSLITGSRSICVSNQEKEILGADGVSEEILNFKIGNSSHTVQDFFDSNDLLPLDRDGRTEVGRASETGNLLERERKPDNYVVAGFGNLKPKAHAVSENLLANNFDTGEAFMKLFPKDCVVASQSNSSIAAGQDLKNLVEDRIFGGFKNVSPDLSMNHRLKDTHHLGKSKKDIHRGYDIDGEVGTLDPKAQHISMTRGAISEEQYPLAFTSHMQTSTMEWSARASTPHHLPFLWQQQQKQQEQQRAPFPGSHSRGPLSHTQQHLGVHGMPFNHQQGQQNAVQQYEQLHFIPYNRRVKTEPSRFIHSNVPGFPAGISFEHEIASSQMKFPLVNSQVASQHLYHPVGGARHLVPSAEIPPSGFPFHSIHRPPFLHEHANNVGIQGLPSSHVHSGMEIPHLDGSFNSMQGGFPRGHFVPVEGAYRVMPPFASDLKGQHRQI